MSVLCLEVDQIRLRAGYRRDLQEDFPELIDEFRPESIRKEKYALPTHPYPPSLDKWQKCRSVKRWASHFPPHPDLSWKIAVKSARLYVNCAISYRLEHSVEAIGSIVKQKEDVPFLDLGDFLPLRLWRSKQSLFETLSFGPVIAQKNVSARSFRGGLGFANFRVVQYA